MSVLKAQIFGLFLFVRKILSKITNYYINYFELKYTQFFVNYFGYLFKSSQVYLYSAFHNI